MLQILVNGLSNGLQLALLSLAFALVYRSSGVLHLALGGIFAMAPFIAWSLSDAGRPLWLGAMAAVMSAALLSAACGLGNHLPLERRGAPASAHTISSLGLMMVLCQVVSLAWSDKPRAFALQRIEGIGLGSVVLSWPQAVSLTTCLSALALYLAALGRTRWGERLMATASDPVGVALLGISVSRVRAEAYLLSGAMVGLAALLMAGESGFDTQRGLPALVLAMTAMIVGGRGLGSGPVLGGLGLGLARELVSAGLGARWQEPATFLLMAVFLVLRHRERRSSLLDQGAGA